MLASLESVRRFAQAKLAVATDGAQHVAFAEEKSLKYAKVREHRLSLIADIPRFGALDVGYGVDAWAALLFVDLRNSSKRAEAYGAKATYLTMHTYLPTMAYLVGEAGGHIVGYRGDGLFAAFGIDDYGSNPPELDHCEEVRKAIRCAKAMVESVDDAINPVLIEAGIPGGLLIGVGIDASKVVITRIGLREAYEVTAYGTAVNKAAKESDRGNGEVMISIRAKNMLGTSGKKHRWFKPYPGVTDAVKVNFPPNYWMLGRTKPSKR